MIRFFSAVLLASLVVFSPPVRAQACQCSSVYNDLAVSGVVSADSVVSYGGVSIPQGGMWCAADLDTGGAVNAGTLVSAGLSRSSATAGAAQGIPLGTIYRDTVALGWASVNAFGNLVRGANIASTSKPGTGIYRVTLVHGAPNVLVCIATVATNYGGTAYIATPQSGPDKASVDIVTQHTAGGAADRAFNLVCFGG